MTASLPCLETTVSLTFLSGYRRRPSRVALRENLMVFGEVCVRFSFTDLGQKSLGIEKQASWSLTIRLNSGCGGTRHRLYVDGLLVVCSKLHTFASKL